MKWLHTVAIVLQGCSSVEKWRKSELDHSRPVVVMRHWLNPCSWWNSWSRGRSHWCCLTSMVIIKTGSQSLPTPSLRRQPAQHMPASETGQKVAVLHLIVEKIVTLPPVKASLCFLQGVVKCSLLFVLVLLRCPWDTPEMWPLQCVLLLLKSACLFSTSSVCDAQRPAALANQWLP